MCLCQLLSKPPDSSVSINQVLLQFSHRLAQCAIDGFKIRFSGHQRLLFFLPYNTDTPTWWHRFANAALPRAPRQHIAKCFMP
jgi:hypothetical protein